MGGNPQRIPYYLIISLDKEEVEVFQLKDGVYTLAQKGDKFTYTFSLGECSATIDFSEIW